MPLDVKSMNMLLTRQAEVKITDFGLSRVKHEAYRGHTESEGEGAGLPIGSLPWMAPELVNDEPPTLASGTFRASASLSVHR